MEGDYIRHTLAVLFLFIYYLSCAFIEIYFRQSGDGSYLPDSAELAPPVRRYIDAYLYALVDLSLDLNK